MRKGTGLIRTGTLYGVAVTFPAGCRRELAYRYWSSMYIRCYSTLQLRLRPTYRGCQVCDEWHDYSNFKCWFDQHFKPGLHLDKDLLVPGSRVYSPATCAFIPQVINNLFLDCRATRGKFPIGVSLNKRKGLYGAQVSDRGKIRHLGCFETPEEAHIAWRLAKAEICIRVANEALASGGIDQRVYDAVIEKTKSL